jgi:hypothetical protein
MFAKAQIINPMKIDANTIPKLSIYYFPDLFIDSISPLGNTKVPKGVVKRTGSNEGTIFLSTTSLHKRPSFVSRRYWSARTKESCPKTYRPPENPMTCTSLDGVSANEKMGMTTDKISHIRMVKL